MPQSEVRSFDVPNCFAKSLANIGTNDTDVCLIDSSEPAEYFYSFTAPMY